MSKEYYAKDIFFLLLFGAIVAAPLFWLTDFPQNDVLTRYIPMAQLWAEGQAAQALHPRIPPLFAMAAGGVVRLLHCDAYTGVKLTSLFFFLASVWPLYMLSRMFISRRTTLFGCILFLLNSQLLRLAVSGLRDSAKGFFFIAALAALCALIRHPERRWSYVILGAAAGGMMLIKEDCVLFALCFLLAATICAWRGRQWLKPLGAIFICLLLISPYMEYNRRQTGWFVPGIRFAGIMDGITRSLRSQETPAVTAPAAVRPSGSAVEAQMLLNYAHEKQAWPRRLMEFIRAWCDGLYWPYALPALWVIVMRVRRREWTVIESVILCSLLGHGVLLAAQIALADRQLYMSSRYLLPLSALWCPWAALALRNLLKMVSRRGVLWSLLLLAVIVCALTADTYSREFKNRFWEKKRRIREQIRFTAALLRHDYHGVRRDAATHYDPLQFKSPYRPAVFCEKHMETAYFSGGRFETELSRCDYVLTTVPRELPDFRLLRTIIAPNFTAYIYRRH